MDYLSQNKYKNWLIAGLLTANILALTVIWMQSVTTNAPPRRDEGRRSEESLKLLKNALDMNEEQVKRIEKGLDARREQMKVENDRLDELKIRLSEELFVRLPDTTVAQKRAQEIGEMQAKLELTRFQYFKDLLDVCTPEQQEKLKAIVREVFGRKPREDERREMKSPVDNRTGVTAPTNDGETRTPETARKRNTDRPGPPSIDEKLDNYSKRLNLSGEQRRRVRSILMELQKKGEELRSSEHPVRESVEAQKEKIRKEEDDRIMNILTEDQKSEFAIMISSRRN